MIYPAHIRIDENDAKIQSVSVHCRNTAEYAKTAAGNKLGNTACLAGLLHDMGKYSDAFGEYIRKAAKSEDVKRGSVNHTFAGARFALERWHKKDIGQFQKITSELIACAAGAHHGLFDCIDPDGKSGFEHRLTKDGIFYEEVKARFIEDCADMSELDELFALAVEEVEAICTDCRAFVKSDGEIRFCLALIQRMLLSSLIAADRKDTAEFMLDTVLPTQPGNILEIWSKTLQGIETRTSKKTPVSEIDKVRQRISDECGAAGKFPTGIYRLSVPTGGGKTRSGLRYALSTAIDHKKRRIIFVVPLLTVLEQNAGVIRDWVGNDNLILEHHSNVVLEKTSSDKLDENELLLETWDAPIVITTLVQFLNTLFLGKTSCIRRMHALCDAVVVIDEVQSVPKNMLTLFNLALNFLSYVCKTTFVLCSATQPCLEKAEHPIFFGKPADLVQYDSDAWSVFRRTQIIDKRRPEGYMPEEFIGFAHECLEQNGSVLLICNTKAQARRIFDEAKKTFSSGLFHLSTAMCMEHRIETLAQINDSLDKKLPVFCISTQLVEAGVDFSFGCVIRISAGLDNVIQAAGRCNRSGEFGRLCPVYIMNYQGENLSRLKEIRNAQIAAEAALMRFAKTPETFDNSVDSNAMIAEYYRTLYRDMPKQSQDFYVKEQEASIYSMLSDNTLFRMRCSDESAYIISQAFKTAGEAFSVFDDNTQDVLVPYGDGKACITELLTNKAEYSLSYRKSVLEKAKRFSVSLFAYEIEQLRKLNGIYEVCCGTAYALQPGFYSETTGFSIEANKEKSMFEEV